MSKKNYTNLSKYISLIFRHKPEVIGISLDEHGWADVGKLIEGINRSNRSGEYIDMVILETIVATDEKQRYSFSENKRRIRANQGHSIDVDVELERVEIDDVPLVLYHGTGKKYIESIETNGLIPKSRLYVHLSSDIETAVKVGKRHGGGVLYLIPALEMAGDGYEFYLSKNGVWLTKEVPVRYLRKVNLSGENYEIPPIDINWKEKR